MTSADTLRNRMTPSAAARHGVAYAPPQPGAGVDLYLDANEGPALSPGELERMLRSVGSQDASRYPRSAELESVIAQRLRVSAKRVLVTAGADDAIQRLVRATVDANRALVTMTPTFEIIPAAARACLAPIEQVVWKDSVAPIDRLIARIDEGAGLVAIVSPNNPTGLAVSTPDLVRLANACQSAGAALLVDLAYVEFARHDPTDALLRFQNTVVTRTFSKARGLAGLRVGYAVGGETLIDWARTVGAPFPVAGPSLIAARVSLETGDERTAQTVAAVASERERLRSLLTGADVRCEASEANFVLARFSSAQQASAVWDALLDRGIRVRRFASPGRLGAALRITCPANEADFDRLTRTLREVLRQELGG